MDYARAATRSVASDRMPICMTTKGWSSKAEPAQENEDNKGRDEIIIWSLNVRGISSEAQLKELEQESLRCKQGILLLQETWRSEMTEKLNIGDWVFYGTGNKDKPRGNGTGVLIHRSIRVESWHHITSRMTAIRIPYGNRHLVIISAYAPVQQGGNNNVRTTQFYEQLSVKTRDARNKGDIVIIGGDMNASIKQNNAPQLIGKWASHREGRVQVAWSTSCWSIKWPR